MKTVIISSAANTNAAWADRVADMITDVYVAAADAVVSGTSCVVSDVSDIVACSPAIWETSKEKAQRRMEARMAARGIQIIRS